MTESSRLEMRLTGYGGQGIVLAAYIVGRASIDAGKHATLIQSFGPEARGSSCSATLVISDREVLYPYVHRPSVLVAMSNDGYTTYRSELATDGTLIFELDLVQPQPGSVRAHGIPARRIAESLGRALVQNIVMVGFIASVTNVVPLEAMREAVRASVPPGSEDLNLKAFDAGARYSRSGEAARQAPERRA